MASAPEYTSLLINKVDSFANEADQNHLQKLHKVARATIIGLFLCLDWNAVAVTILYAAGGVEKTIWYLGFACLIFGPPAAALWYKPLCLVFRTGNTYTLGRFFLFYPFHIAFCIFAAVSPPVIANGRYLTGILSALDISGDHYDIVQVAYYYIGSGLFCLESLLSIWLLQQVYVIYRRSGLALVKNGIPTTTKMTP